MPRPAPTKKKPPLGKEKKKQAERKDENSPKRRSVKLGKSAKRQSLAGDEQMAEDGVPKRLALPEAPHLPRYFWPREAAKANSGQPQVLIVQETLIQPNGEPGSTEFYRILVQDRFDTAFSEPLTRNEVIGKSPAEIIEMAEGVSDCSRNIVGYAKDRMSGIWLNHEFHAWPSEE